MSEKGNQQTEKTFAALNAVLCILVAALVSWGGQGQGKSTAPRGSTLTVPNAKMRSTRTAVARAGQLQVVGAAGPRERDPFNVPPPPAPVSKDQKWAGSEAPAKLPPGVRGLVISQLRLEGIVVMHGSSGLIAVVTNRSRRAYFLHENETLYDGVVTSITPQAIFFKENVRDDEDRAIPREVVRRLH